MLLKGKSAKRFVERAEKLLQFRGKVDFTRQSASMKKILEKSLSFQKGKVLLFILFFLVVTAAAQNKESKRVEEPPPTMYQVINLNQGIKDYGVMDLLDKGTFSYLSYTGQEHELHYFFEKGATLEDPVKISVFVFPLTELDEWLDLLKACCKEEGYLKWSNFGQQMEVKIRTDHFEHWHYYE